MTENTGEVALCDPHAVISLRRWLYALWFEMLYRASLFAAAEATTDWEIHESLSVAGICGFRDINGGGGDAN